MLCYLTDLIWREGTPFETMTGRTAFVDGLLAEVFQGFFPSCKVNDKISVRSPWYHVIITQTDVTNMTLGTSGFWLGTRTKTA